MNISKWIFMPTVTIFHQQEWERHEDTVISNLTNWDILHMTPYLKEFLQGVPVKEA